ncbi:glycosyltransferase family 1 protein [Actinomyces viscosus]|uniref:Capsular glucan synthase n=1 Tax=Actinomyces viscosus TaxID=1656 RepID=A0A3S5EWL3_ACTVI|nr:glycosyltransferase family 4 protein [Actinomyces viscosus]TFH52728.1 glycosyltransferase family 1 protein [Actinomyces viscosus]VEI18293.1 Capsular glucan synthase [Actinomyces viscosus]
MSRGEAGGKRAGGARILVAHPSPDLYGSDWQLVETIHGLIEAGHEVLVALPLDGPLVEVLRDAGARVAVMPFTVLRKALLNPRGLAGLSAQAAPEIARLRAVIRASRAEVVLTNTVTIPWWPVAASAAGVPVLAHVHEAEDTQRRIIRAGLNAPLLAASRVVANSGAARDALLDVQPRLASRTEVVHNGVAGPDQPPEPVRRRRSGDPFRIAMVGRLSPRKGVDVALDAVGLLRHSGVDASLIVCGSVFPGYEWYEEELRERAAAADLNGHVELLGYVRPTWPVLEAADAVVVPSRAEPFGNTAVEAMHAARPLVASRVQGLAEVVTDAVTGLLVPADDAAALAQALGALEADPDLAARLAEQGEREAAERFSVAGYRATMAGIVGELLRR